MKKDIHLEDPLSAETRKERRLLLVVSLLGIAMAKARIVPKQISVLGIQLEAPDQSALLYLVAFIVIYLLVAFLIYAASDFVVWRKRISKLYADNVERFFRRMTEPDKQQTDYINEVNWIKQRVIFWRRITPPASIVRAIFEFLLPVLVGVYALCGLIKLASQNT